MRYLVPNRNFNSFVGIAKDRAVKDEVARVGAAKDGVDIRPNPDQTTLGLKSGTKIAAYYYSLIF